MIPPDAAPSAPCRVLIADDNPDAADILGLVLEASGYQVRVAHSGRQALEFALQDRPDAVLLDIGMPDINGYEAARQIRAQPWGARVLIVALTGWGMNEDKARSRAAGFDQHLVKPVDPNEIEVMLAQFAKTRVR